ncbi:MAG TPA: polysaccharide pyruvyl transferase CsaB [Clostridia bacterium]|nr:polysaccharide pyruvyl transferase CsaB [Clostridia bacterium]
MAKIVLSGYFGFNNAGDEAILYAIVKTLKQIEPEVEITVLSHNPLKTKKQYDELGVKALNRWKLLEVLRALAGCDLLLSGGGSLLQDVSSSNSPLYYLGIIFLAKLFDKPVMVYAQGIGPLRRKRNKRLTAWLLNGVNKITVRDEESKKDLVAMGVHQEIIVTADPVLGFKKTEVEEKLGADILERYEVKRGPGEKLLGVYLRPWGKNDYLQPLAQALDQMVEDGWQIVFVPMQFPGDISVAREAIHFVSNQQGVLLKEDYSPEELLSLTKNFDLIVGMRLHALIMAAVAGVPMVGLSYDPKVDRFLRQAGQVSLLSVNNLQAQPLVEVLTWVDGQRAEIIRELDKRTEVMYQKAWQTARIAMSMLENSTSGGENL